jgi:molybdopterin-containing oxidoreductase family iron-sulfur binding subunit
MSSKDSKINFARLKNRILQQNGKEYWRSVEEFVDAPEFAEFVRQEYPTHAEEWDNSLSRRNFIKVMGASLALAGLSGCVIQPAEKIVPYVTQPENIIPGKPLFFATAMTLGGIATGLLVRSNEGRPTKIEGNPDHPGSFGATDVLAQASLLGLYDPDRSKEITYRGEPKAWQTFLNELRAKVNENRADGGAGIRFLSETITSPTLADQFEQLKKELPNAKWYQYEPINKDNVTAGAKMAFGSAVNPVYKFDQAQRILSLDADIFSGFNVRYIKDFAKSRNFAEKKKDISRLYAIETTMTLTGAKADHRLAVKPSQMAEIAKAIAAKLGVAGASSGYTENAKWLEEMAKDLKLHSGKSIVIAGDHQPPIVHALVFAMNEALGNIGKTVEYLEPNVPNADTLQIDQLRELIKEIDSGSVKMLVVLGGNPVYNTPADLKLNADRMLNKIPFRVHVGQYFDETAELCQWHVSEKHYLESWGDTRAFDGTVSIVQPLIEPLYGSRSIYEVVQLFFKENYEKKDYDIVREYWQKQNFNTTVNPTASTNPDAKTEEKKEEKSEAKAENSPTPSTKASLTARSTPAAATAPKNFEDNWRKAVHDGFISNTASRRKDVKVSTAFLSQAESKPSVTGSLEFSILPDPSIYDGRFANNGWLQELPNPLTKITWENVALISPQTAKRLGLNRGNDEREFSGGERPASFINSKGGNMFADLVTVKYQGGELTNVPVWITPGQPEDVITLYLGYGRTKAGKVGTGIGYDAYQIRRSDALYFGTGEISKTGNQKTIASTQIHFNIEGRDLLLEWELDEVETLSEERRKKEKKMAGYDKSMYPSDEFQKLYNENYKWGMTIDLNSCIGCNACVIACQAENNIPVVGREQVERSREMHWMRVDAYYSGSLENPDGPSFQPVLCQQCELAPCEVVCPVHATVHSAEGLNDMVYNRCIGTRYCSNNCPYKVRRFNFLLYQDWNTPQYKLMRNPEVTIRSRGVMEKCTYCTQRISAARIEAEKDGRKVRDGEVLTACQAVCPADAISFGDLNDKSSQVAKSKEDIRNYTLLIDLNTQPRTTYLANLKNQNKEMPDYKPPVKKESQNKTESH